MAKEKIAMSAVASKLDSSAGAEKVASLGTKFIKTQLREDGIARRIIPFEQLDLSRAIPRVDSDEVYELIEVEPNAGAVQANFTAQAPVKFVNGKRVELTFSTIKSETYEKNLEGLMAIKYDIFDVIKKYIKPAVEDVEDRVYLKAFDSAVNAMHDPFGLEKLIEVDTEGAMLTKSHFRMLKNTLDGDRLKASKIVCANTDLNDVIEWDATAIGFDAVQEIANTPGALARYNQEWWDMGIVGSIKTDLFREKTEHRSEMVSETKETATATTLVVTREISNFKGKNVVGVWADSTKTGTNYYTGGSYDAVTKTITLGTAVAGATTNVYVEYEAKLDAPYMTVDRIMYVVTEPEFLGAARKMNDLKFWAKKEENIVSMGAWENIGMVIANARAIGKIKLSGKKILL